MPVGLSSKHLARFLGQEPFVLDLCPRLYRHRPAESEVFRMCIGQDDFTKGREKRLLGLCIFKTPPLQPTRITCSGTYGNGKSKHECRNIYNSLHFCVLAFTQTSHRSSTTIISSHTFGTFAILYILRSTIFSVFIKSFYHSYSVQLLVLAHETQPRYYD